ncbi:MAG TPA: hypothetical protein VMM84_13325 [Pyrinomonadaceae bacterium]|nr:hypothetical protein [Pyrinomonadaceae bacterium]
MKQECARAFTLHPAKRTDVAGFERASTPLALGMQGVNADEDATLPKARVIGLTRVVMASATI